MLYAYWGKQMKDNERDVDAMAENILEFFRNSGVRTLFGGTLEKEDLPAYHYKIMMPYFNDSGEWKEFDSFEQGLAVIRKNFAAKKSNTVKVYEMVIPEK